MMSGRSRARIVVRGMWVAAIVLFAAAAPAAEFSDDWRTVTPEELAMTSDPGAPGAAAVYLYTQFERLDEVSSARAYQQIKILTEEGRKYADVELRYDMYESIRDIEARVVQPDGRIVPFKGTVYERPVVTGREVRRQAKTFTLPDVRVGSVVEVRFRRQQRADMIYNSRWVLSQDLFTRHARYAIKFYKGRTARWTYPNGLPAGASAPELKNGRLTLELRNVPAFVSEGYMPPVDQSRYMVDFKYSSPGDRGGTPDEYWSEVAKNSYASIKKFVGQPAEVRDALARIVAPGDSREAKVAKIYDHVQQLRNTTYQVEVDAQEAKRRKEPDAQNAADVGKHGYGDSWQLQCYFLALVRAADVPAQPMLVARRANRFFNRRDLDADQLTFDAVAVSFDAQKVLLDPSTPFVTYGTLHWADMAVPAMELGEEGGKWVTTPAPKPAESVATRVAKFTVNEEGDLEGTVKVTYTGQEAMWRRLSERNDDEQARREFLEKDLRDQIAGQSQVKLLAQPNWQQRDAGLQVEYQVKLPQWATLAGNRILFPVGVFGGAEKGVFVPVQRVNQIYYNFPARTDDEVRVTAPAGFKLPVVPDAQPPLREGALAYSSSIEAEGADVLIRRELSLGALLAPRDKYPEFRDFYEGVRAGDQQQVVLVR